MSKECPNSANHTQSPTGYVQWHEWAHKMKDTHEQTKCPGCGLWAIWVPKQPRSGA
jgi:hypothetical protein